MSQSNVIIVAVTILYILDRRVSDRMVVGLFTTNYLCNQCLSPLKLLNVNPVHDEVYTIQHYVIEFSTGRWFSPGTPVSSTNKTDRHDIAKISLG